MSSWRSGEVLLAAVVLTFCMPCSADEECLKEGFKKTATGGAVGAAAGWFGVPTVAGWLGFAKGGIIAGSTAAKMMSVGAPLVSTLQSIGATGVLGPVGVAVSAGMGATAAAYYAYSSGCPSDDYHICEKDSP